MKFRYLTLSCAFGALFLNSISLYAQKGTGASSGVARDAVKPALESLVGTVTSIKTGPC
jgi:hypothetical protein